MNLSAISFYIIRFSEILLTGPLNQSSISSLIKDSDVLPDKTAHRDAVIKKIKKRLT